MPYLFCSLCGNKLKERDDCNLVCTVCEFVNYRNPRPTVTVLVSNKNRLLLTKRLNNPFKAWWDLPGGFIDRGEHPETAAIRELKEETGLDIKLNGTFGIYTGTYPSDTDSFHVITIVYRAECDSDALQANDDVIASQWFEKKEIPSEIAFDSNQSIMKDFLNVWN